MCLYLQILDFAEFLDLIYMMGKLYRNREFLALSKMKARQEGVGSVGGSTGHHGFASNYFLKPAVVDSKMKFSRHSDPKHNQSPSLSSALSTPKEEGGLALIKEESSVSNAPRSFGISESVKSQESVDSDLYSNVASYKDSPSTLMHALSDHDVESSTD